MKHLIVGYGYCGRHLTRTLVEDRQKVIAWSRSDKKSSQLPSGCAHRTVNIATDDFNLPKFCDIIHYLIPPQKNGREDFLLKRFISKIQKKPQHIIYYGSSGIYGDHQGRLINEQSPLNLKTDRQFRRYHAEQQLLEYCQQNGIKLSILRIAGIYGSERIPLENVKSYSPIITPSEAPISNRIYIQNLVEIAVYILKKQNGIEIYNVSDGHPKPIGYMQRSLCSLLNYPDSMEISYQEYFEKASNMQREFLANSKQLDISKLKDLLPDNFTLTKLDEGLKLVLSKIKINLYLK
jgi:nucleoside-diphosphate-sugar epimerase